MPQHAILNLVEGCSYIEVTFGTYSPLSPKVRQNGVDTVLLQGPLGLVLFKQPATELLLLVCILPREQLEFRERAMLERIGLTKSPL